MNKLYYVREYKEVTSSDKNPRLTYTTECFDSLDEAYDVMRDIADSKYNELLEKLGFYGLEESADIEVMNDIAIVWDKKNKIKYIYMVKEKK